MTSGNQSFGAFLVVLGAVLAVFHRPLGALHVRLQPHWMHPWANPAKGSSAIVLIIGLGLIVSGLLELFDILGWMAAPRSGGLR